MMINEKEKRRMRELANLIKEDGQNSSKKSTIHEKAESEDQQQAMGMALAARRGEMNVSDLKGSARDIYYSDMTNKEIEDYAETSHDEINEKFDSSEIELKRNQAFHHPYRRGYYSDRTKTKAFKDDDNDTRAFEEEEKEGDSGKERKIKSKISFLFESHTNLREGKDFEIKYKDIEDPETSLIKIYPGVLIKKGDLKEIVKLDWIDETGIYVKEKSGEFGATLMVDINKLD